MIELIWGILNIAILIYFIIVCFKSAKIIREKLGALATLVFILVLLSFVGRPDDVKPKVFDVQDINHSNQFKGHTYFVEKKIEDNLMNDTQVSITFGENEKGKEILRLSAYRNGFISGTSWKVLAMGVDNAENENIGIYNISGILEWRLMGFTIYSELKEFKGKIELKK